ncbi:hypothetical protein [Brevibacterium limosum]|uniref:hypothetical protein n=1 Tax=Brevibacterium limosum TaxID=2697565 RepID=UPI0014243ABB|nr:hypothetical protein [Brevibacterium limosum]
MTIAHRHRSPLTLSALVIVALGLPIVLPFSATIIGWTMQLPMRLNFAESMLATLGVFSAWFVVSRTIDVILDGSAISGTLTGRAISAAASLLLLGGGYLLIIDSVPLSVLIAAVVSAVIFMLSTMIDLSIRGRAHAFPVLGARRRLRS